MSQKIINENIKSAAKHHGAYVAYAFGILRSWPAAEDAVQEAYLVLSKSNLNTIEKIFPWMRSIVRNKCFEHIRANRKEFPSDEVIDQIEEQAGEYWVQKESREALRERIQVLRRCLAKLNDKAKRLLHNYYVLGQSCEEIACDLGQKPRTSGMQLYRVRKQLRECLKSESPDCQCKMKGIEENEEVFDNFFTNQQSDEEKQKFCEVLNRRENGSSPLIRYIEEYASIASALTELSTKAKLDEQSLEDENSSCSIETAVGIFQRQDPAHSFDVQTSVDIDRSARQKLFFSIGGVAAILCLSIGLWVHTNRISNLKLAEIALIEGRLQVIDGEKLAEFTSPGTRVSLGLNDSIKVGEGSKAIIRYPGESTSIEIAENTELSLIKNDKNPDNHIYLREGELLAEIDRQAEQTPFAISTPLLELNVLGTRFRLRARPLESSITLFNGRLLLKDKRNEEEELLNSGEHCTLKPDGGFSTRPIIDSDIQIVNRKISYNEANLISFINFDEYKNGALIDLSYHGLRCPLNPTWDMTVSRIKGIKGNAFHLLGTRLESGSEAKPIIFSDFPYAKVQETLSLSIWLNPIRLSERITQKTNTVVRCRNLKQKDTGGWQLELTYHTNTQDLVTRFVMLDKPGSEARDEVSSSLPLTFDTWNHIALSYNAGRVQFYVNGEASETTQLRAKEIYYDNSDSLFVGGYQFNQIWYAIDELYIFNRELTHQEIKSHYDDYVNR